MGDSNESVSLRKIELAGETRDRATTGLAAQSIQMAERIPNLDVG